MIYFLVNVFYFENFIFFFILKKIKIVLFSYDIYLCCLKFGENKIWKKKDNLVNFEVFSCRKLLKFKFNNKNKVIKILKVEILVEGFIVYCLYFLCRVGCFYEF